MHPIFRRLKLFGVARLAARRGLVTASQVVGRKALDRERTIGMLAGHEIRVAEDAAFHLPDREPIAGEHSPIFGEWDVVYEREHVWRLKQNDRIRSMRITPTGTILLNRKYLLDTDFGSVQGVSYLPLKRLRERHLRRRRFDVDIAIAPWSHSWGTYYEFVVHILSKLCWIKEFVDPSTWAAAKICYPLREESFEHQYMSLLGVREHDLLHTEYIDPIPRELVMSNLQRGLRLITPTRLASLRRAFLGKARHPKNGGRRIYLSRENVTTRQVLNEAEVRRVASSYGLEIIEAHPESVEEQIRLFSEASLIVAPHGSALTNLVWCSPGTQVIEFFGRDFLQHVYSYISLLLGLRHGYLVHDTQKSHHWTHGFNDMVVDTRALARALEDTSA